MSFLVGDFYHDLKPLGALASNAIIASITTDTTTVGATIDTQGYSRVLFAFASGTLTDGAYVFHLYHGDESDMSDEAEVASTDINGTLPSWAATADDTLATVELVARKRYCRVKIVSTATTNGGTIAAAALLGAAKHPPVQ